MPRFLALCLLVLTARAAEPAPLRAFVLGDWGWADPELERKYPLVRQNADLQRAVAKAMAERAARTPIAAVLTTGDNFYPNGVSSADDPRWRTSFEEVYAAPALQVPWIAALGNHDHDVTAQAELDYAARSKGRWVMPARHYSHHFPAADVRVLVLDACSLSDRWSPGFFTVKGQAEAAAQWRWLEAELAKPARWKVVVGHLPVKDHGFHGPESEYADRLGPLLEKHGVRLYLNGHDHHAEIVRTRGVAYVTCGNGSDLYPTRTGPEAEFIGSYPGFTELEFGAEALQVRFLDAEGKVRHASTVAR